PPARRGVRRSVFGVSLGPRSVVGGLLSVVCCSSLHHSSAPRYRPQDNKTTDDKTFSLRSPQSWALGVERWPPARRALRLGETLGVCLPSRYRLEIEQNAQPIFHFPDCFWGQNPPPGNQSVL